MRDYRLGKEKETIRDYVKGYKKHEGKLKVEFARNSGELKPVVFEDVERNKVNIDKLNKKMNDQIAIGIKNKAKIKLRKDISTAITIASAGVAFASTQFDSKSAALSLGIISVFSLAIFGVNAVKRGRDLAEIKKAEICDDWQEELSDLDKYPNALSGLDNKTAEKLQQKEFLITEADDEKIPNVNNFGEFYVESLEHVVSNITKERKMGFVKTLK